MQDAYAGTAQATARNQLQEGRTRLGETSGVRSGSGFNLEREISVAMANSIAEKNMELEIQAALQRNPDLIAASGLGGQFLDRQSSFARDKAALLAGGGQTLGSIPDSQSGLGGLLGLLLSAGGAAGGFGNLFGSGSK
jgi:hypothetical protein